MCSSDLPVSQGFHPCSAATIQAASYDETLVIQALGSTLTIHNALYLGTWFALKTKDVKFHYSDRFIKSLMIFIIPFSAGITMTVASFIKDNHHG